MKTKTLNRILIVWVFNGLILDFLKENLSGPLFYLICEFRYPLMVFVYAVVIVTYVLVRMRNVMDDTLAIAKEAEDRKNELVVYLAHDLKTPLTSVIGYLSMLEECPDLPADQRAKFTGISLDKAYRLEELVNEFFEITRYNIQGIELENNHLDIRLLLHQLLDEFYPVFKEKNIHLEEDIPEAMPMIADSDKLARVFDNLLRNASLYCPNGGTVKISCSTGSACYCIHISNQGDEIPPEKLQRIFDKFFRVDSARSSRGGAGLGLAIAKNIVELHRGIITAESNSEWTSFHVKLPIR